MKIPIGLGGAIMQFPINALLYSLLTLFIWSCSVFSPHSAGSVRNPSVSASSESCIQLSLSLLQDGAGPKKTGLKLSELPFLDLTEVKAQKKFKKLAELNTGAEDQEKSYYILAHLKKNAPELDESQILKKYRELFRSCD